MTYWSGNLPELCNTQYHLYTKQCFLMETVHTFNCIQRGVHWYEVVITVQSYAYSEVSSIVFNVHREECIGMHTLWA